MTVFDNSKYKKSFLVKALNLGLEHHAYCHINQTKPTSRGYNSFSLLVTSVLESITGTLSWSSAFKSWFWQEYFFIENDRLSTYKLRINLPLFSTVVPSNICMFLSCRPFVVITLSTGLGGVEVTSVSWLGWKIKVN
jgi:hypothetical protein